MTIILRGDRVPVRITGAGAQKLLNDTLTTRIDPDEAGARWWALLSPQGKILAEGLIGRANGAFWLDVDATIAENFLKRMRLYRLRAEVEFDDLSLTHTVGWSQGERPASQGAIVHKDRRTPSLGVRLIAEKPAAIDWLADDSAYQKNRIANGIAELGHDFDSESLFPHDVGMDLLGGIDFAKGCYIGQEVVSRMQHRGTARRRPVIVTGDTLVKGEALMAGAREAGTLGTPSGTSALSIARLDRFTASPDASVGGHPVALVLPEWASYGFGVPDSAETTAPAAT